MSNLSNKSTRSRQGKLRLIIAFLVLGSALLLGAYLYTQRYQTELPLSELDYLYLGVLLALVVLSLILIIHDVRLNSKS